jgi:hypothetical protein
MVVVVGLQQHVTELGERNARFRFNPGFHRVLGEHRVDGDVLSDIAQEIKDAERSSPITIVDQTGLRCPWCEVKQHLELGLDRGEIGIECRGIQQVAL